MRVLIAGGGIGGLAAALALARDGAGVEVLERAEAFGEVGAGLQLAPNATRILHGWGLEAALARIAFAPQAVEVRDHVDARLLHRTQLGAAAVARWGAPYLQVHRADLHAVLLQAARDAGVTVQLAAEASGVRCKGDQVRLEVGGAAREADLLVAADGLHSGVRSALFGATPARFIGETAWRGLVATDRLPPGLIAPAATVWTGRGRHFVHYYVRGGELVSFVGFTPERAWREESWRAPARPGEIAAAFAGWPAPVVGLIAAMEAEGSPGWRWAVHDRAPLARWRVGRVVLLGDAAHPMPPFLAQGAGMAVEDAESLARHLRSGDAVETALAAYAGERKARTAKVRSWARRNGRVFHLPRLLRRAAFRAAELGPWGDLDWLYGSKPSTR
jgi:salicylate hydroxylase